MSNRSTALDRQERLVLLLSLLLLCSVEMINGDEGVCEDCPPGWYDSIGPEYDCEWYAVNGFCPYGDGWENFGYNAQQACCECGGGTTRGCDVTGAPTMSPTEAATLPNDCEECPLGWYDSDGEEYDCEWYAANNFCDQGAAYENFGVTAMEACCECNGDNTAPIGTCTLTLDDDPTTASPTISPNACVECYPGWHDSDGEEYTCAWYGENGGSCLAYGDGFENFGYTANQACCECGGGCELAPTVSPAPTQSCTDCEGWYDSDGPDYDCEWYEANNYCDFASSYPNFGGLTAVDACCFCGGTQTTTCDIQPAQASPSFIFPSQVQPSYATPTYLSPSYFSPTYFTPTYGDFPTYEFPTYTFPTAPLPPVSEDCVDEPADWYDSFGPIYDCTWYEENFFCQYAEFYANNGIAATDACCACGGGAVGGGASGTFVMIPMNVKNSGFERDEQWVITDGNPMRECGGETIFGECHVHFSGGSGEQRIEQVIADVGSGTKDEVFNLMFYASGVDLPGKKFFKGYIKTRSGSSKHSYPCRSTRDGTFEYRLMKCTFVVEENFDEMAIIFRYLGDSGEIYLDKVALERGNQID